MNNALVMESRLPRAAGAGIEEETGGVMLGALWVALCGSFLEDSHGPEGQGAVRGHLVFSADRFPVVQKLPSGNNIGTHSLFLDWAHSFPEIFTQYQNCYSVLLITIAG